MAYRDPAVQLRAAKQIARDHNHYMVERKDAKGRTAYLLYREGGPDGRGVLIGKRGSVPGAYAMVCKACNFH